MDSVGLDGLVFFWVVDFFYVVINGFFIYLEF